MTAPMISTGTTPDRLVTSLVDVSGAADLTWIRDGDEYARFYASEDTPTARGTMIREVLALISSEVDTTDVLLAKGEAVFGQTPLQLPDCIVSGYGVVHTQWKSTSRIDSPGGPGFTSGANSTVRDMYFSNVSYDPNEDSSVIGFWSGSGPRTLTIERCMIDGSEKCDWTIYNWFAQSTIVIRDSDIASCRMALVGANSGSYGQALTVERTRFFLDANGSATYGASSGADPVTGGILSGILLRSGTADIEDVEFFVTGLASSYHASFGCPRVALITDQYYSSPGTCVFNVEGVHVRSYTPGIESVANVIDVRGGSTTMNIDDNALMPASGLPTWTP